MIKLFLCCLFGGFLIICFSQDIAINNPIMLLQQYRAAENIYQQAEKISPRKGDSAMSVRARQLYRESLSAFEQLEGPAEQAGHDSLLFCLYFRQGNIYYKREKNDSALFFYKKAETINNSYNYLLNENQQYYSQLRSITVPHGLLFKQAGDQLASAGRYYEAIQEYHKAILQFDTSFTTTDIYRNPTLFTESVPFVPLASAFIAKGDAFTHLRPGSKNIKALSAAAGAYRSALELAEYIANTDSSKEARSFPGFVLNTLDSRPIKIYNELFELTGQKNYLEDAYLFDQRKKILDLYTYAPTTSDQKRKLSIPSIASLQQLIDKRTAILSYNIAKDGLSTFVITRAELNYHIDTLSENFFRDVFNFRRFAAGNTVDDPGVSMRLYQKLISPIYGKLKGIKRLIIIPDYYNMNYLPFEAFKNKNKSYLLEEFSVQYQYSTALLGRKMERLNEPTRSYIASYPGSFEDFHSYTDSIHQLTLDSAQLVIFIAVNEPYFKNNTLLNLSESFRRAGCPNLITSLWKADDESSAFVTKQLHEYLDEGYSRDKALQLARLDLLRNNDIDPSKKTASNWANMVLVGEYEPPYYPTPWIMIAIIASVIAAVVWVVTVKSNY